jgi:hypothetical protein
MDHDSQHGRDRHYEYRYNDVDEHELLFPTIPGVQTGPLLEPDYRLSVLWGGLTLIALTSWRHEFMAPASQAQLHRLNSLLTNPDPRD